MARAQMMAEGRQRKDDEWYAREQWKRRRGTPAQEAEARKTLAYLPELKSLAQDLQGVEIPAGVEAAGEFAREYIPLGSAAAAGIERAGMTPEAMKWLERGRQSESDIIRLASGLAVTGFELENVKKWSPWAANLTNTQRTDRLRNVYNKLGREGSAIGGQPWAEPSMEQFMAVEGGGTAPQVTPGQVVAPPGPGATITPDQIPPGPATAPQTTPYGGGDPYRAIPPPPPPPMPQRPPGLEDSEWQRYLQLEGLISG